MVSGTKNRASADCTTHLPMHISITSCSYTNSVCLEEVIQRCFVKKVFLEISQISQENTCTRVSFLIKLPAFIKKENLAQVFSCEFCKVFKNTSLHRTPLVAASVSLQGSIQIWLRWWGGGILVFEKSHMQLFVDLI